MGMPRKNAPGDGDQEGGNRQGPGKVGKQLAATADGDDAAGDAGRRSANQSNPASLTVFVGQLPYTVTAEQLEAHFRGAGLQDFTVRLLTHKDTGKSRGMAFVQFEDESAVQKALKLHKSAVQGRQINVEPTLAGSKKNSGRREKLGEMRASTDAARVKDVRKLVRRVACNLVYDPSLLGFQVEDADERVMEVLMSVPEKLAAKGLEHFAAQPARKVLWNRPALLMVTLRKFFQESQGETPAVARDALGLYTVKSKEGGPHLEMAAGAIVCKRKQKEKIVALLPDSWKRHHVKGCVAEHMVTNFWEEAPSDMPDRESKIVAIHLSPEGAAALWRRERDGTSGGVPGELAASNNGVPGELSALLTDGGAASFRYGLRAGSASCKGEHSSELLPARGGAAATARFRFVDLFSGIGGFRVGLERLGGECVFASDVDSHARRTYSANFEDGPPAGDITQIEAADVPAFDVLTAGFPCQPFSIAGGQEGTADPKGVLFLEVTRLLRAHRPAVFLLENVPQMERIDRGRVMKTVLAELRRAGYTVLHRTLSARPVVPQRRLRLYLVGFDSRRSGGPEAAAAFQWPAWADDADQDLAEYEASTSYSTEDGALATEADRAWPAVGSVLEGDEEAWAEHELTPVKMDAVARQDEYWNHTLDFHFVNEKGAARTLIGSYLKFGRSDQLVAPRDAERRPRLFTLRECCRLMGFPDSYTVLNARRSYHELGNAVCPPVVKDIMQAILDTGILPSGADEATAGRQKKRKRSRRGPEKPSCEAEEEEEEARVEEGAVVADGADGPAAGKQSQAVGRKKRRRPGEGPEAAACEEEEMLASTATASASANKQRPAGKKRKKAPGADAGVQPAAADAPAGPEQGPAAGQKEAATAGRAPRGRA